MLPQRGCGLPLAASGCGTVFLQRWKNGNDKDQVISGKSYLKLLFPPLCIYSLSSSWVKNSLPFSDESTRLWATFLALSLPCKAFSPRGCSWWFPLHGGCRSVWGIPQQTLWETKTCWGLYPVQPPKREDVGLSHHPCFCKDSGLMLEHWCAK